MEAEIDIAAPCPVEETNCSGTTSARQIKNIIPFLDSNLVNQNLAIRQRLDTGSSTSGSADWYPTKAAPNCSRADGAGPFRMERVALNVERLHLGIADLNALFVSARVRRALDFQAGLWLSSSASGA